MFMKLIGKRDVDKKLQCSAIVVVKCSGVIEAWLTSITVPEANWTKFRQAVISNMCRMAPTSDCSHLEFSS